MARQDKTALANDRTEYAQDRTEFAEDRTLMANERTFAGWMRTGLAAVGVRAGLQRVVRRIAAMVGFRASPRAC